MPQEIFTFEVDPLAESNFFRSIEATLGFTREMKKLQGPLYDEWFSPMELEQFTSEGSTSAFGRWQALTPRYAKWKKDKYGNLLIEQLTGALGLSLIMKDAPHAIDRVTADDIIEYGSDILYAMAQHAGVPARNLPPRVLISLTQPSLERAHAVIEHVFEKHAVESGFGVAEV